MAITRFGVYGTLCNTGVLDTLAELRDAGHTVAVLSNGNPAMLEALLEEAALSTHLEANSSVDAVVPDIPGVLAVVP